MASDPSYQERGTPMCRYLTTILYILALTLLPVDGIPIHREAHAGTKLRDLYLSAQGDRARMVLLLDGRPSYSLSATGPREMLVTLLDTTAREGIAGRMQAGRGPDVDVQQADAQVRLRVSLEAPPREVVGTWLPDEELLSLEFVEIISSGGMGPGISSASLKHIRFGEDKGRVRMVTEYTGKPRWEWTVLDGRHAVLKVPGSKTLLQAGSVSRGRGVSEARLSKGNGETQLEVLLQESSLQARIFWLEMGNRLVADFTEGHPELDPQTFHLPRNFGLETAEAVNTRSPKLPPAAVDQGGFMEETSGPGDPGRESSHIVKMKVPTPNPQPPKDHPVADGSANAGQILSAPPGAKKAGEAGDSTDGGRIDPKGLQPEEALLYGRILEARNFKDYERGSALIAEFTSRFPKSILMESLSFLKGDLEFYLLESGREDLLPQMEAAYRSAIDLFPDSKEAPTAYLRLAEAHSRAGNDYQAIGYLNILISRYPQADVLPKAYLQRGNVHLQGMFPEKSLEDYRSLLKSYPGSPLAHEARYGIITYLHKKKLYEEAEKWFKEMDQLCPDFHRGHPEYLWLRAQNHLYLKEYPEARRLFFKAVNAGAQPETSDLLLTRIGDTCLHEGKEKEAQRYYRLVVEDFPGTEGSSLSQLRLADFTSGTEAIEQVREQNVDRPIGELALLKMANVYFENDKTLEAMDSLKGLVAEPPKNEVHSAARQLYYKAAKKELMRLHAEEQLDAFVGLLKANESLLFGMLDPELRFMEGKALLKLGRTAEAARALEKIQAADLKLEDRGSLYRDLVECYRGAGDNEKAIRIAQEGRGGPVQEKAKLQLTLTLADLKREQNDLQAAYRLYEEVISGQSLLSSAEVAHCYYHMGLFLNRQGNHEKARELLNRAMALAQRDKKPQGLYPLILVEIGESYFRQRRTAEAVKAYRQAFQEGYGSEMKGYWPAKFRLAECHLELGEAEPAEAIFREISDEGDPDLQSRVQIRLGAISLERQLMRLSIWDREGVKTPAHVKQ